MYESTVKFFSNIIFSFVIALVVILLIKDMKYTYSYSYFFLGSKSVENFTFLGKSFKPGQYQFIKHYISVKLKAVETMYYKLLHVY